VEKEPAPQASLGKGYGAPLEHPATEDQVREYLSLVGYARTAHTVASTMIRTTRMTALPYFPASYWDDMDAELRKIDVVSIAVPVYQEYFSVDDMQAVIDFYRSSAGKKLLNTQPVLTSTISVVLRKRGEEVGKAVFAKHKDEIETAKKEYDSQHASPASK